MCSRCVQDKAVVSDMASNLPCEKLMENIINIKNEDVVKKQETVDGSSCSQLLASPQNSSVIQSPFIFYDETTNQEILLDVKT